MGTTFLEVSVADIPGKCWQRRAGGSQQSFCRDRRGGRGAREVSSLRAQHTEWDRDAAAADKAMMRGAGHSATYFPAVPGAGRLRALGTEQ